MALEIKIFRLITVKNINFEGDVIFFSLDFLSLGEVQLSLLLYLTHAPGNEVLST